MKLTDEQKLVIAFAIPMLVFWLLFYYLPKRFFSKHFPKQKVKTENIVFVNTLSPVISNKKPIKNSDNFNYKVDYKKDYSTKYVKTT